MDIKEYLDKKKEYEFYILNINKKTPNYNDIIELFCDSLVNPFFYEENDCTIVLSSVTSNDIVQLTNAIIEDFGVNLKVFKSNKLNSNNLENQKILMSLYFKYNNSINDSYISIRNLVQAINDNDDINLIKPVVTERIINDNKLYEIVKGMFINNLNVCKTASYVYMHRNTINNKLIVIKEVTGLDIQNFQDAVILYALLNK